MKFKVGDRVWSDYFDSEGVVDRIYDEAYEHIIVKFDNTTTKTRELCHGAEANEWVYFSDGSPIELCEDEGSIILVADKGAVENAKEYKLHILAEALGLSVDIVAEAIVHVARGIK